MALGGWQFQPGVRQDPNGFGAARSGAGQSGDPVQQAIQVLGLRLPKRYGGAGAIVPESLAFAPGGMGQPGANGNVTAQALAMMAGLPANAAPEPAAPSAPVLTGGPFDQWMQREREMSRSVPEQAPAPSAPPPSPGFSFQRGYSEPEATGSGSLSNDNRGIETSRQFPMDTTPSERPRGSIPQDWLEDFLRRNPGDLHRAGRAFYG